MQAIGAGDLAANEAAQLTNVITGFSQTVKDAQLEERLDQIEKALALLKRE